MYWTFATVSTTGFGDIVPGGFGVTVFFFLSGYLITTLPAITAELPLKATVASICSFDVVVALELIEHIPALPPFAAELDRILRPGGAILLSTPARLRSLIEGEPHFNLRGITWLPLPLQRILAARVFGRNYPYPITRQSLTAGSVLAPFRARGMSGTARMNGRLAERSGPLRGLIAQVFWNFILIRKPASSTGERPA